MKRLAMQGLEERRCLVCKNKFQQVKPWQKFCSERCKKKANGRMKDVMPRGRSDAEKSDYNLRFFTAQDYADVQAAAAKADESMNLFIVTASLERAKSVRSSLRRAG